MQTPYRGLCLLVLVCCTHCAEVITVTSMTANLREGAEGNVKPVTATHNPTTPIPEVHAAAFMAQSQNATQLETVSTERKLAINSMGQRLTRVVMLLMAILVIGFAFVTIRVYEHSPKRAFAVGTTSGVFEKWVVPLVMMVVFATEMVVYNTAIKPSRQTAQQDHYANLGILGLALQGSAYILAVIVLWKLPGNRAASFMADMTVIGPFILLLVSQTAIAMMVGEWMPFDDPLTGKVDTSISTTMDYLGGAESAVLGLCFLASLIPVAEALHVETTGSSISWGRGARMILATMSSSALFWVAMAPIKNKNMVGLIDSNRADRLAKIHGPFAVVSFLSLFLFIALSAFEHHSGPVMWLSVIFGFISLATAIITHMIPYPDNRAGRMAVDTLFSLSEYCLIIAVPMTLFSRFGSRDQYNLMQALGNWGKSFVDHHSSTVEGPANSNR